jgi:7-carboxy-7-deazaguanine synthase
LVEEAKRSGAPDVVVTGGEPMMFDQVEPLTRGLRAAGLRVTIETAGTVFRREAGAGGGVACDLMSISPKLSNSTPTGDARDPLGVWAARHEGARLNVPVLQGLLDAFGPGRRQLKFVVATPGDLVEVEGLLGRLTGWDREDVLLMPEGVLPAAAGEHAWVVEACLRRGWRYCRRLHVDLFGNRRGT